MKTNHQRGYKDTKADGRPRKCYYSINAPLSEEIIYACVHPSGRNGKHKLATDAAGAKKNVRSRVRFHENNATINLLNEYLNDK